MFGSFEKFTLYELIVKEDDGNIVGINIYPRSFKDSDSDGVGDLKGIEEKAEYLKDLGVNTIWLSPIFKSPMADMGYDISDFNKIDPIFGTMNDFKSLRDKIHSLVNPDYYRINVETQKNDPTSHYNVYKNLTKLRSNEVFRRGDFKMYIISERVFAFRRSLEKDVYVIVMNLNNKQELVDFQTTDVKENFKIALVSGNSEHKIGDELSIPSNVFIMRPKSAIVLQAIISTND